MSNHQEKLRVFIFQQRNWGLNVGHFLVKEIQKEFDVRFACLTIKKTTDRFVRQQSDIQYEHIVNYENISSNPDKFCDYSPEILKEMCAEMDIDSIWPLMPSDRFLTMNYGKRYYYSFEQGVPDEYLCKWIAALYTQIKKVFDEFQPNTIILPNLVSASHLITYYLAKKRNVKVISINDTKVQPYYSVVHCPFNADSDFVTRLNEMLENREVPKDLEKVRSYIKEASEKVKAPPYMKRNVNKISLANEFNVIKNIVKQIIMYYAKYDALRIYKIENLGPNIDYKTPYILMRDYWVSRINTYKVKKLKYNDVRKVGRFAYFPLQVQPEATLEIQAPWFANQIETIRNIAMSLPEDMTLVVKEHPEMIGKRYPSYYRKIQKSLNVKLVSSDVPQEYLLKNCDVLIGTNGTVICEAAFSRTPVIQLGLVGMMHKLPNVVHHTDLSTIPQAVRKALSVETHSEEYDRQLECYVGAAFEAGFKMDYTSVWVSADQNALDELYSIFKGAILNELQRQKTAS